MLAHNSNGNYLNAHMIPNSTFLSFGPQNPCKVKYEKAVYEVSGNFKEKNEAKIFILLIITRKIKSQFILCAWLFIQQTEWMKQVQH